MAYPKPVFSPASPTSPPSLEPTPAATRPSILPDLARRARGVVATTLPPLLTLLLILAVWQAIIGDSYGGLPSPKQVWLESKELILNPFYDNGGVDKGLFWHVATSLQRVGIGFSISAVVGVLLGVLVGSNLWAHRSLDPIFQVLRTVPPLAWLPISLAAFHQAQPSALFVIFITAIWPIIINTAVGVRNIPSDYVNVAKVLRLSPIEYFFKILLPATTPYIFTGLRIGIGMSWLAIVASEMLLGGVGIGFFIWDAWNSSRISDIIVALVYIGIVGFLLDKLIATVGHFVSHGVSAQ